MDETVERLGGGSAQEPAEAEVGAGEMICVDNYRLMHGRDGYRDPERRVLWI